MLLGVTAACRVAEKELKTWVGRLVLLANLIEFLAVRLRLSDWRYSAQTLPRGSFRPSFPGGAAGQGVAIGAAHESSNASRLRPSPSMKSISGERVGAGEVGVAAALMFVWRRALRAAAFARRRFYFRGTQPPRAPCPRTTADR